MGKLKARIQMRDSYPSSSQGGVGGVEYLQK